MGGNCTVLQYSSVLFLLSRLSFDTAASSARCCYEEATRSSAGSSSPRRGRAIVVLFFFFFWTRIKPLSEDKTDSPQ